MKQNKGESYYKNLNKKQPFFSFIKRILRLFFKKPKIVYIGKQIESPSIILSNHVSLKGPVIHELYLPIPTIKWGAGEMLGNYKMRYNYLRNVFYIQKKKYNRAKATLLAGFCALFSKPFYKEMHVIPTWSDARMFKTFTQSLDALCGGASVLIFPENSYDGYKDVLAEFYAGFVTLAETYYSKTKKDIPVYTVYYDYKKKVLLVDEPKYIKDFAERGLTRTQTAEEFCRIANGLHDKIHKEYP